MRIASAEVQNECINFLISKLQIDATNIRKLGVVFEEGKAAIVNIEHFAMERNRPVVEDNSLRLNEVEYHFFSKSNAIR